MVFAMINLFSWQNPVSLSLLYFVLQGQTCLLLHVSLDFLFLHSNPLLWKRHVFLVLILAGLVGLHRTSQLQLLWHYWLGHYLDHYDVDWFVLESNQDNFVCFEVVPMQCILDFFFFFFFFYSEDCSISSKGFLPTVADAMVIWIKFAYSSPF